jgi:predicted RNA-binding Zn-ribbon protein involved in translation (DUF1610 family)
MVEYDGKTYDRDKRGKYRCPWRCGDPNYPQPSWSTEAGFLGHLAKCKGKPEKVGAWSPAPVEERVQFGPCPDCGKMLWKDDLCWWMGKRIVCYDCRGPYQSEGRGFQDWILFDLPCFSLEI